LTRAADNRGTTKLGVLFVHGIGEQPRGDTLLRFGDPCIAWLERWLEKHDKNKKLSVSHVQSVDERPTSVTLTCKGEAQRIQLAESWWARKFAPPPVNELSWWLLLVGTWAILSHAAKPVKDQQATYASRAIAFARGVFVWAPAAFSFQIVIIALSLAAAVPIAPWRSFVSRLLLTLSATLGDSYVLLHSQTQFRLAVESVTTDIETMVRACEKTMVVAHSQGAAIAHEAIRRASIEPSKVLFVTVGSGVQKLRELKALNHALEFRGETTVKSAAQYALPAGFVVFWVTFGPSLWFGRLPLEVGGVALIILFGIAFGIAIGKYRQSTIESTACRWLDVYASSDPVANGPTNAPGTDSVRIVNEKSLLRDHTAYFSNRFHFIPRLVAEMKTFGNIDWIDAVPLARDAGSEPLKGPEASRVIKLGTRKTAARFSTFLNWAGFIVYEVVAFKGLSKALASLKDLFLWAGHLIVEAIPAPEVHFVPWGIGVLCFVIVDLFVRWCDRTADRTFTNLLFTENKGLSVFGTVLFLGTLVAPLAMWFFVLVR